MIRFLGLIFDLNEVNRYLEQAFYIAYRKRKALAETGLRQFDNVVNRA